MLKIFVLGSTGMLGHVLCDALLERKKYQLYSFGRRTLKEFGLNSNEKIKEFFLDVDSEWENEFTNIFNAIKPDFIINCIGVVKQLVFEDELKKAININSIFVQKLDKIVNNSEHTNLIHLSTDCVFSGNKGSYVEDDIVDPVDIYGITKALGEIRNSKKTLTIRTSIIGREIDRKIGLLEWLLSQNNNVIKGYDKFIFSGLTTYSLSNVIIDTILENFIPGIMHISSEAISKYDLLNKIKSEFKLDVEITKSNDPICDRSLDSSYFKNSYNYRILSWDEMIKIENLRSYHSLK